MMGTFTTQEWSKIDDTLSKSLTAEREPFGFPELRGDSVVLGTFNIRKLGKIGKRKDPAWRFLARTCGQFDLLAIQEVQDELTGIQHLHKLLGPQYQLLVSDTTGQTPGTKASPERLAFVYRPGRIRQTELASDISFDRTDIAQRLFRQRDAFHQRLNAYQQTLTAWEQENAQRVADGRTKKAKPPLGLPTFLTFIRQPHCAAFEIVPKAGSAESPIGLLIVNAHLLYGTNKLERRWEFKALIDWLAARAKMTTYTYHDNLLMMGDCNLEFKSRTKTREMVEQWLKTLNSSILKSKKAAKANFPLLDEHPDPNRNPLRTNARQSQTYDQIALFSHDSRLPTHKDNAHAGQEPDGFDYGIFRFTDLFASAVGHGLTATQRGAGAFDRLSKSEKKRIIDKTEWDVSDHMPAWMRLPIPK